MTPLPNGITRYTGANCFSAEDAAGNLFYVFQKQNDTGCVIMVIPDGTAYEVLSLPVGSGRPSLECNPLVGLWAVGNKETSTRATPPRYPILAYQPFVAPPPAPNAGGVALLPSPRTSPQWDARLFSGGELLDIPATFGVPPSPCYLVRVTAHASAPNVRVRMGTQAAPFFLTLNTQVSGVEIHTQGWTPGPAAWISTVNGAATVWVQILGW